MKNFRFFTFDSMGRIDRGLERECQDDAEALSFAKQQTDAATVEVWREQRLIAKLNPRRGG
jgi:hypothetical protein